MAISFDRLHRYEIDPAAGVIIQAGAGGAPQLEQARGLAGGFHRAPYIFPT